jgi:hypothetical protein
MKPVASNLAAKFGRTACRLSLGELDAVLGAVAAVEDGRGRNRDLGAARERLRKARDRRRAAVARAGRW